jgi:MFS family permease
MKAYYHKVWGVLLLGWLSLYMVRVGLSPLLLPILDEFHLTYSQAGVLSGAVFWAYAAMQIPSGYLGDKWGHRRFLLVGTLSWTILSFLTSLVTTFGALILVRLLTGLAQGTYFGNDRPLVVCSTPHDKMARGQAISIVGMGMGMGLGILCSGQIAEVWGWRWVFVLYSIPSLLAFTFIWKTIQEPPRDECANHVSFVSFSRVIANPRLLLLCLSNFAVMYAFWVLGAWAPTIFMEIGVASTGYSGLYSSILGFIGVPALLLSGSLSDRLRRTPQRSYAPVLLAITFIAVLTLAMGIALDLKCSPFWFSVLLLFTGAAIWSSFPPLYTLLADTVTPEILGTTFGILNTWGFIASLVAPWITGLLKDMTNSFAWAFYASAVVMVIGIICCSLAFRMPSRMGRVITG